MPFEQIPYTNFHGTNQDWMIQQIKQMIADWASYRENLDAAWAEYKQNLNADWADYQENINNWRQALDAAFTELHTYVHDYFDNLDVQEEINNKLDDFLADGTLDAILLPYFNTYTTQINTTVGTQNNKIATLESRVDNFLDNTGTLGTEKDPELIDIRVAADSNVYATAGDAVRGQFNSIESYVKIGQAAAGSDRSYINLGKVNGFYKVTHVDTDIWASIQGYNTDTYDGERVYDSGRTNNVPIKLDSDTTNLYYRVCFGAETGKITDAMIAESFAWKFAVTVDDTLTVQGMPADSKAVRDSVNYLNTQWFTFTNKITAGNRCYVKLGIVNGTFRANSNNKNIWVAVQGYDSYTYDGTKIYDSGTKYGEYTFTIENNSNVYYRIVFGKSAFITEEEMDNFVAQKQKTLSKYLSDTSDTINNIISSEKTNLPTNIVTIMHGGTTSYPSNTLGLYKTSYNSGIMYWETDVRPCLDGYVLCHDNDIYNHALSPSGEVIPQNTVLISENTVATLQTYKFGIITNQQNNGLVPGFENDTIPTLQEFLQLAKAVGAHPVLEIKFTPTQAQMIEICNIVKKYGMLKQTYILGYQSAELVIPWACQNGIKNLAIIISNGAATNEAIDTAYGYISEYIDNLDDIIFEPTAANLTVNAVEYAASKGMRSGIWTVAGNATASYMLNLYNMGCTAFTTNRQNVANVIRDSFLQ